MTPIVIAVILSHAVAVVAVSHSHYFCSPPSRQMWFWLELAIASAVYWPARSFVRWVLLPAVEAVRPRERPVVAALPVILGGLTAAWWAGQWSDNLWLHSPTVAAVLRVVLVLSHAAIAGAGYAALLAVTIRICRPNAEPDVSSTSPSGRTSLLLFALFLVAANAFAWWYLGRERIVYYWDYMVYWTKTVEFGRLLRDAPPVEAWDQFRQGVKHDDYGPLPVVLPATVTAAFGGDRLVYVLAVVNLYLAAVGWAAVGFVRRFAPRGGSWAVVVPLLAVLLSPLAWAPLLHGYLDIGGAALAIVALTRYLDRPAGGLRWNDVIVLAATLAGMALFRRWYSYFVVALLLLAGLETGWVVVRSGGRAVLRRVGPLVLVGVWLGVLVGVFATPWVRRVLTTDYGNAYAAYQSEEPLWDRAGTVVDMCGPANTAVVLASIGVLLWRRETRRIAWIIGVMPSIMLVHMLRTADPGIHNCYLFLPAYVLLPSLAVARVVAGRPTWVQWSAVTVMAVWGVAAMAAMFVPEARLVYSHLRPAVSCLVNPPLVRDDLPELERLLHDAAGGGRVYVAASSPTLNPTLFVTADRSLGRPVFPATMLLPSPEVDRVGGFPAALFEAGVVVTAWPPQTHLRPAEQQVVVLPAERLYHGTGIGKAFDRLPGEYRLDDGVVAYVYKRARLMADADVQELSDRLRDAHPGCPGIYTPPPDMKKWLGRKP